MGGEFRTKGVNVLLGPVVGPIGRVVRGGRNWEGFSSDPYLSGILVASTVSGVQDRGVMTSTKVRYCDQAPSVQRANRPLPFSISSPMNRRRIATLRMVMRSLPSPPISMTRQCMSCICGTWETFCK